MNKLEKAGSLIVLTLIFAEACLLSGCAHLDRVDKGLIATVWAVTAVDIYQSRRIDDYPNLVESTGFLQDERHATVFLAVNAGAVTFLACTLPDKWRKACLGFYIGGRTAVIENNYSLGIR